MNLSYFTKLSWVGIKNNRRLYVPYIMTCIGMVAMLYLVGYLETSKILLNGFGARTIGSMMFFGKIVLTVFSIIFLFYTNSFLMKKRRKEFGLYNILGMNKRDIGKIMFFETLIVYGFSMVFGTLLGVVFSRLGELLLMNIAHLDVSSVFEQLLEISIPSILYCAVAFGILLFVILLNGLRGLLFHNPIQMLRSENHGEKPPRANWIMAILGVAILVGAYTIALWNHNPLLAMVYFFVAVVMVIIATYILFISGSVALCRILQRNANYYYKQNHFTSVASMVYRMKRNGAGLASICILCTMILVTMSSTTTLMNNVQASADAIAPADFATSFSTNHEIVYQKFDSDKVKQYLDDELARKNIKVTDAFQFAFVEGLSRRVGNTIQIANRDTNLGYILESSDFSTFVIVSLADYNKATGSNLSLKDDEVAVSGVDLSGELILDYQALGASYLDPIHLKIVTDKTRKLRSIQTRFESIQLVVSDIDKYIITHKGEELVLECGWAYYVNVDAQPEQLRGIGEDYINVMKSAVVSDYPGSRSYSLINRSEYLEESYSIYGGIFFLGLLLSVAFLFGTVLIIYYKQLSEGFEDQSRFDIMKKVGMSEKLIRKSINSQVLTVFFAPLIAAGIHLAFSLPITLGFLSLLFNINNVWSVVSLYAICYSVFAVVYVIIYKVTSNTYYKVAVTQVK